MSERWERIDVENRLETVVLSVRLPVNLAKVLRLRARHKGSTISAEILAILRAEIERPETVNSGWPPEYVAYLP